MKIYIVNELSQASDSDGWQFWVDESPISYHKTSGGAEQFRTEQLTIKAKNQLANIERNPHLLAKIFEDKSRLILENKQMLVEGTQIQSNQFECEVLQINEVELKK